MISSAFPDFNSPQTLAYGTKIAEWVKLHHPNSVCSPLSTDTHLERRTCKRGLASDAGRGSPTANHIGHASCHDLRQCLQAYQPPPKIIGGKAVTPVEHYTITATVGEVGSWVRYHRSRLRRPNRHARPCRPSRHRDSRRVLRCGRIMGRRLRDHQARRRHQHAVRPHVRHLRGGMAVGHDRTADRLEDGTQIWIAQHEGRRRPQVVRLGSPAVEAALSARRRQEVGLASIPGRALLAGLRNDSCMAAPQSTNEILALLQRLVGESVSEFQVLGINSLKSVVPTPADLVGSKITGVSASGRDLTITLGGISAAVDLQRTGRLVWLNVAVPARVGQPNLPTVRLILGSGSGMDFTEPAKTKRISVTLSTS